MKRKQLFALLSIPLVVLSTEAFAWVWMHPHRTVEMVEVPTFVPPREKFSVKFAEETNEEILKTLGADRVYLNEFQDDDYYFYRIHDVQWNGASALNVSQVLAHRPEVCFGASGVKLTEVHPVRDYKLGGLDLNFDVTEFEMESGPLFVYKMPWIDGFNDLDLRSGIDGLTWADQNRRFRINAVLSRFQPRFARVLMINVFGQTDEEEAWKQVEKAVLPSLVLKEF